MKVVWTVWHLVCSSSALTNSMTSKLMSFPWHSCLASSWSRANSSAITGFTTLEPSARPQSRRIPAITAVIQWLAWSSIGANAILSAPSVGLISECTDSIARTSAKGCVSRFGSSMSQHCCTRSDGSIQCWAATILASYQFVLISFWTEDEAHARKPVG